MNDILFWANVIGWIAFVINVLSYQAKTGTRILYFHIYCNALWSVHYFLLGANAGVISFAMAAFRNFVCVYLKKPKWVRRLVFTLLPILWFLGVVYAESYFAYVAILGGSITTISVLYHDRAIAFRNLRTAAQLVFIVYGFALGSWPVVALNIFALSSNMIGAIRHEPYFAPMRRKIVSVFTSRP